MKLKWCNKQHLSIVSSFLNHKTVLCTSFLWCWNDLKHWNKYTKNPEKNVLNAWMTQWHLGMNSVCIWWISLICCSNKPPCYGRSLVIATADGNSTVTSFISKDQRFKLQSSTFLPLEFFHMGQISRCMTHINDITGSPSPPHILKYRDPITYRRCKTLSKTQI